MCVSYMYYYYEWRIDKFTPDRTLHGGNFIYCFPNECVFLVPGTDDF